MTKKTVDFLLHYLKVSSSKTTVALGVGGVSSRKPHQPSSACTLGRRGENISAGWLVGTFFVW